MELTRNGIFPEQVVVALFADFSETLEKFLIALAVANYEECWGRMVEMQFSPEDMRKHLVDGRLVMLEQDYVRPLVVTAARTGLDFVFELKVMAFGASISDLLHRAQEICNGFPDAAVENLPLVQTARAS